MQQVWGNVMDKTTSFKVAADYRVPLLWIMAQLEQAHNANVLNEFERQFQQLIPPHHMGYQGKGKLKKWQDYVQWARQAFVNIGLMGSAGRGVWTITSEGKQWLDEHPDGGKHELNDVIKEHYFGPKPPKPPKPPKQTDPSNAAQHRMLDERILEIRSLIEGRATSRPDDQVLCSWVWFCYDFALYTEGAELFNLINPDNVEPAWLYQQARKMALVCRMNSNPRQPDDIQT